MEADPSRHPTGPRTSNSKDTCRYLNVGCGSTFDPSWTNVDIASTSPHVLRHDLRKGLPFEDSTFDACYHSHVLEHFDREGASFLLRECHRVLRSDGAVRVAVPDLEGVARAYLSALERAVAGHEGAEADYDWMMLEMYDQTIRSQSGGDMGAYLSRRPLLNGEFVRARLGAEAESWWNEAAIPRSSVLRRLARKPAAWWLSRCRIGLSEVLVRLIAGGAGLNALQEGLFRNQGEIHRWMYDRFSLARLLSQAGFMDISVCRADESRIPGFCSFNLDLDEHGVRKPDSLFMEGSKP